MLHGITGISREVMLDVQRMVIGSDTIDELCGKLAKYWDADERGLQLAVLEWKERAATRRARAARASQLLQFGQQVDPSPLQASSSTEQQEALRKSRQIRLELLVEQLAQKVFPN